jgi:hypothetical protein
VAEVGPVWSEMIPRLIVLPPLLLPPELALLALLGLLALLALPALLELLLEPQALRITAPTVAITSQRRLRAEPVRRPSTPVRVTNRLRRDLGSARSAARGLNSESFISCPSP